MKSGGDDKRKNIERMETTEEIGGEKIKMERQKQEWLREERDRRSSSSSSNSTTLGVLAEGYK